MMDSARDIFFGLCFSMQIMLKIMLAYCINAYPARENLFMELEVCTSLGSMFHRRGALFVKEILAANGAG